MKKKQPDNRKSRNDALRYAGLGMEMAATIGILAYIGHRIDESREAERPWFTLLFALLGIVTALYRLFTSIK